MFRSARSWNFGRREVWRPVWGLQIVGYAGRLKIGKSGTFTGKFAELALAEGGVMEVPAGMSQMFNSVFTNGVVLSSGRYTSLPNGEGDFLAGGGEIVVRRHGVVITLQ